MELSKQIWPSESEERITITHTVKTLTVGDVEDPDIYVGQYIWEWQSTEEGKWIMEHSMPAPSWHRFNDINTYGYKYLIKAYLTPQELTYWRLKFE